MTDIDEQSAMKWEGGELGASVEHARVAKGASARLDASTGMKLVTIRLPVELVDTLKEIAVHHGLGYQPMVRDLLIRFAVSEVKLIQRDEMARLRKLQENDSSQAVDAFFEREREAACG